MCTNTITDWKLLDCVNIRGSELPFKRYIYFMVHFSPPLKGIRVYFLWASTWLPGIITTVKFTCIVNTLIKQHSPLFLVCGKGASLTVHYYKILSHDLNILTKIHPKTPHLSKTSTAITRSRLGTSAFEKFHLALVKTKSLFNSRSTYIRESISKCLETSFAKFFFQAIFFSAIWLLVRTS